MNEFLQMVTAFGNSIWTWLVEHKDEIYAFVMSGQFVSLIVALVTIFRQFKQVKLNTNSSQALNKTLANTNTMSTSVTQLDTNFQLLKAENDSLRSELKETENKLETENKDILNKLNAIIEVQGIVYSTIRDDGVRQTVNTILNNARYSEQNFKESLEQQIDELKNNYAIELENINQRVTEGLENLSSSLKAGEKAKATMSNRTESTRY